MIRARVHRGSVCKADGQSQSRGASLAEGDNIHDIEYHVANSRRRLQLL